MPNWCENRVCFKHSDTTKLAELDVALREGKALQYLHPMPSELEGTTAPSDTPNWYDWCVNNWGTKWDVHDEAPDLYSANGRLYSFFRSAWAPPIAAFEFAERNGWKIEASFCEPAVDFIGEYKHGMESTYSMNDAPGHLKEEYDDVYDWFFDEDDDG